MDICHPFLCNWVQGVARTSREGDRDEQAVGAAGSITLRNGACLVGAGDRSQTHQQPGGSQTCWPPPVSLGYLFEWRPGSGPASLELRCPAGWLAIGLPTPVRVWLANGSLPVGHRPVGTGSRGVCHARSSAALP